MNSQMDIESITDRLLGTLDREAEHLGKVIEYLAELSRLVLKRDERGLQELLEQTRHETLLRDSTEGDRKELIATIADIVGCQPSAVTLSMLEGVVPVYQPVLHEKRLHLRQLVEDLRKQHYSTTMLLGEMIRINRSLLAGITGNRGNVTYGRGGRAKWTGADNILNLRY
jgi:hypothetical protein